MQKLTEITKGYEDEIPVNPGTEPTIGADTHPRPIK